MLQPHSELPNIRSLLTRINFVPPNQSESCFNINQNSQIFRVFSQESSLYLPINQSLVFTSNRIPKHWGFSPMNQRYLPFYQSLAFTKLNWNFFGSLIPKTVSFLWKSKGLRIFFLQCISLSLSLLPLIGLTKSLAWSYPQPKKWYSRFLI